MSDKPDDAGLPSWYPCMFTGVDPEFFNVTKQEHVSDKCRAALDYAVDHKRQSKNHIAVKLSDALDRMHFMMLLPYALECANHTCIVSCRQLPAETANAWSDIDVNPIFKAATTHGDIDILTPAILSVSADDNFPTDWKQSYDVIAIDATRDRERALQTAVSLNTLDLLIVRDAEALSNDQWLWLIKRCPSECQLVFVVTSMSRCEMAEIFRQTVPGLMPFFDDDLADTEPTAKRQKRHCATCSCRYT